MTKTAKAKQPEKTKQPAIFDQKQYPRETLAENVNDWNNAHRALKLARLKWEIDSNELKRRKKELDKAFDTLYCTHPEDGVGGDDTPLLDGIEPTGNPGSLKIEIDLAHGAMAAAQLFPQVKTRLTRGEFLEWTRNFLDAGDEILNGSEQAARLCQESIPAVR